MYLRGLSPSGTKSTHGDFVQCVTAVPLQANKARDLKKQAAIWVFECRRHAEAHANIENSDGELCSAIAEQNFGALLLIQGAKSKQLLARSKTALRKPIQSNAPRSARSPQPDRCNKALLNPGHDACLYMAVGEVTEHRIRQVVKGQTRQSQHVEFARVPATSGKQFKVHAGEGSKAFANVPTRLELFVEPCVERCKNAGPCPLLHRSAGLNVCSSHSLSVNIRSTFAEKDFAARCWAVESFPSSPWARLAFRYRCTLRSVTHRPRSLMA